MKTNLQQRNYSPKSVVRAINAALVSGVGVIDYLTGVDVSVIVFYWFPISIGTWFGGRRTNFFGGRECRRLAVGGVPQSNDYSPAVGPHLELHHVGFGGRGVAYFLGAIKDRNRDSSSLSAQASVSGSWLGCKPN